MSDSEKVSGPTWVIAHAPGSLVMSREMDTKIGQVCVMGPPLSSGVKLHFHRVEVFGPG